MSGVISTSSTAVVMTNTASSISVTIAGGVSISGTGKYGIGVYSKHILLQASTIGEYSGVVGVTGVQSASFTESIVNLGSIGGTTAGVEVVWSGNHYWLPASAVTSQGTVVPSTIFASATIVNDGTVSGGSWGVLMSGPPPSVTVKPPPGVSVLVNDLGALIEGGTGGAAGWGVFIDPSGIGADVVNAGTILTQATYGAGVEFGGTITNLSSGLISAIDGPAIEGVAYGGPLYVLNAGRIDGLASILTSGMIVNTRGGTITKGIAIGGTSAAVAIDNGGYIGGSIAGENLVLTNSASGTILGATSAAIYAADSSAITNYGLIGSSAAHDAIHISGSGATRLFNATGGTINGDTDHAIVVYAGNEATITNRGLISGIVRLGPGTTSSTLINSGVILADSSAPSSRAVLNGQAVQVVGDSTVTNAAGGTISTGTVNGGFAYAIGVDGVFQAFVTNQGLIAGEVEFGAGGTASSTLVNAGTIGVNPGGYAVSFAPGSSDRLVIDPSASFVGDINGGNTVGSTAVSTLEFTAGAGTVAGFGGTVVNFAQISIDPGGVWLLQGGAAGWNGETVTGLSDSNTIELVGTVEHKSSFAANTLTLDGGTTLNIAGSYTPSEISVTNDGTNTFINACFAEGTRIATARGEVAVENLLVGDRVLTVSGRLAPVRWLGHRRTDIAHHPRPQSLMPVRIRAGAFGPDLPVRDLLVSPDHAVFADGHLFHARFLVNGVSIVTEQRQAITYWHVELDRHDIILAEGLPCESYLDTGNRAAFENAPGPTQLHPDFEPSAHELWEAEGCAPVHTDPGDVVLRGLRLRLIARAGSCSDVPLPCNADMALSRSA